MRTHLKFYGYSDDLVEVEGTFDGCDEYNRIDRPGIFKIADETEGLLVIVEFGYSGTWMVGVAPVDEETPMPTTWNIRIGQDHDYSAMLVMSPPENAKLTVLT